jgi:hypothetical protein
MGDSAVGKSGQDSYVKKRIDSQLSPVDEGLPDPAISLGRLFGPPSSSQVMSMGRETALLETVSAAAKDAGVGRRGTTILLREAGSSLTQGKASLSNYSAEVGKEGDTPIDCNKRVIQVNPQEGVCLSQEN